MNAKYFVDTNVLMYAHDVSAGEKHKRARQLVEELWRDRAGVVSTQVLQELAVNLRRKSARPLDAGAVRQIVIDYMTWQVVVNTGDSILEALTVEERYKVSFWNALMLQSAERAGVDVLYSEDLSNGQFYGLVQVRSPFLL